MAASLARLLAFVVLTQATTLYTSFRQECPVILEPDRPSTRIVTHIRSHITFRAEQLNGTATNRLTSPRIVNGDLVQSDSLREIMVVLFSSTGGLCTGSLISSTWVLTAAHCELVSFSAMAIVGTTNLFSDDALDPPGVERIGVGSVFNHPEYSDSPSQQVNDIALVRLSRPASTRRFMRLNMDPSQPKENSISRVAGYGVTEYMGSDLFEDLGRLRQVDVPIFPISECIERYGGTVFAETQLCAGYSDRSCDSCQGDSGGPIFQYDEDDNPVQVGIVSFGIGCGEPDVPGVYVRTSAFREYIESVGAEFTAGNNIRTVFDDGSNAAAIAGAIVAVIVVIVIIILLWFWYRRRRRTKNDIKSEIDDPVKAMGDGSMLPPTTNAGYEYPQAQATADGQPLGPPPPPSATSTPPTQQPYPSTTVPGAQTYSSEATKLFPPPVSQQTAHASPKQTPPLNPAMAPQYQTLSPAQQTYPPPPSPNTQQAQLYPPASTAGAPQQQMYPTPPPAHVLPQQPHVPPPPPPPPQAAPEQTQALVQQPPIPTQLPTTTPVEKVSAPPTGGQPNVASGYAAPAVTQPAIAPTVPPPAMESYTPYGSAPNTAQSGGNDGSNNAPPAS